MKLEFYVPIFDLNYIGENKSSQDMWSSKNNKLKDYSIDTKHNIVLKKSEFEKLNFLEEIDLFSKDDCLKIRMPYWAFTFECEENEIDDYKQKLDLLLLAFRITEHSDLSIKYIICKNVSHLSSKYSDDWKYTIAEKKEKREIKELNKFDLEKVILTYVNIKEFFKVSPRTAHAVNFLFLAYTSFYWMEAFMLLMTALETLVSPDERKTIVEPVTNRIVSLINDKNICSKTKFGKIYELRSDIIHGKVLVDINFDKELPKLQQLQRITLSVFNILLKKDFRDIYKDENSKENFYKKVLCNKTFE